MKRLQVMIEEDLDEALERAARLEHTSKSELVRRLVRERVAVLPPIEDDPLMQMAGADDFEPAPIYDVV